MHPEISRIEFVQVPMNAAPWYKLSSGSKLTLTCISICIIIARQRIKGVQGSVAVYFSGTSASPVTRDVIGSEFLMPKEYRGRSVSSFGLLASLTFRVLTRGGLESGTGVI